MRFFIRKRRQPPAVIIVALVDVLIVLLIFLMVTTTFKQQPAMKLVLPESTTALRRGASDNPPMNISITTNAQLFLGADKLPVTWDRFKAELAARAKTNSELVVAISADKNAPVGQFVKVYDALKEVHAKAMTLYT